MDSWLHPHLSTATVSAIRSAYGILLGLFLLHTVPHARRFFVSDRWRGYAKSSPAVDAIQNPIAVWILQGVWFAVAAALILGKEALGSALINLLLCRYYFIHMRWKSVLRGGGAPGFFCYWLGAAVFLLELGRYSDALHSAAVFAVKADLAFILLSAGAYKLVAGYPRNNGMEFGLVNPWWGYWWRFYRRLRPSHFLFRSMNHLAYATEIVAAVLLLIPATQAVGAILVVLSFAWIATQIRLGWLCEMLMVCGLLCLPVALRVGAPESTNSISPAVPSFVAIALYGYAALLPLAHAGLWYNLLRKRPLPGALQKVFEAYTNFFGVIIWRVFTADITNFYVRIRDYAPRLRYAHVCESIALCSVFTTLKYYASNPGLFEERLLRYARTIPGEKIEFEYVSIQKFSGRFEDRPAARYLVDTAAGTVRHEVLDAGIDLHAPAEGSPIHEGAVPGSYVSKERA